MSGYPMIDALNATHPLTPREKAPSMPTVDLTDDMLFEVSPGEVVTWAEIKRRTALASGSGDHAELAKRVAEGRRLQKGPYTAKGVYRHDEIAALLAENAALRAAKWEVKHVDTMNDMVLMGMARDEAETRATEAERKLAEAVDDERARGQVIISERDKWIVELISERDEAKAILRDAVSEAVPDAMIFAGHPDAQRYSKALDGLRNWTARARTLLSKEAERG